MNTSESQSSRVNNKKKGRIDDRIKQLKVFSIASVVIIVAIILVVNILFDNLLGSVLSFDFSFSGQNTISETSESFINSLPDNETIRIVGLMDKPTEIKKTPFEYICPLLDDYVLKSNGRIVLDYVNPSIYPSILAELDPTGLHGLQSGTFVVKKGEALQIINPLDCFSYDSNYLRQNIYYPISNNVESAFTNAIAILSTGFTNKAYYITGLGESTHEQLSYILSTLGIESEDISASDSFIVPDDCDLLFIAGINQDISASMAQVLIDYLENGGKIIAAIDFKNNVSETYTNLNTMLDVMNLKLGNYLVKENDPNYMLDVDGYSFIAGLNQTYSELAGNNILRTSYCRAISVSDNPDANVTTSILLGTSDRGTLYEVDPVTSSVTQFANQSSYIVGMHSTFSDSSNPPEVYLIGTTDLTSDEYIGANGYSNGNVVFIRNLVRNLLNVENRVLVENKAIDDYKLDPSQVTQKSVSVIITILMVVLPLIFVICGVIVYKRRKNL